VVLADARQCARGGQERESRSPSLLACRIGPNDGAVVADLGDGTPWDDVGSQHAAYGHGVVVRLDGELVAADRQHDPDDGEDACCFRGSLIDHEGGEAERDQDGSRRGVGQPVPGPGTQSHVHSVAVAGRQ
jgi:hypothetical protein